MRIFKINSPTHDKEIHKIQFYAAIARGAKGKRKISHEKPEFSADIRSQLIAKYQTVNIELENCVKVFIVFVTLHDFSYFTAD